MKKIIFIISLVASASVFSTAATAAIVCFPDGTCYDLGDPSIHP
ncbi:TPA: hypothetical protein ACSTLY_003551 [Serratia fonticola]|nr:hypothetical protein [Serratia fonticola]